MRSYICYVRTPAAKTPHLRVVTASVQEDFTQAIKTLLGEWPKFEQIDVYDESDRLVLRMAGDEAIDAKAFNVLWA